MTEIVDYNCDHITSKRFEFAIRLKKIKNENLYFIAETKFSLRYEFKFGWVKKYQNANFQDEANDDRRNVIVLVGSQGLINYVIIDPTDGWEILNNKSDIRKKLETLT